MKFFTVTALISMLSVAAARDVIFEHKRALDTISKRSIHVSKRQQNLATFTGNLGGVAPTPVECSGNSDRPFSVKGDTFVNFAAAATRSCDQQNNACANAANSGGDFSVSDCNAQQQQCIATQTASAGTCDSGAGAAADDNANAGNNNNSTGAAANSTANSTANANAGANAGNANTTSCNSVKRRFRA